MILKKFANTISYAQGVGEGNTCIAHTQYAAVYTLYNSDGGVRDLDWHPCRISLERKNPYIALSKRIGRRKLEVH